MKNEHEYELRGFYKPHFFTLFVNGQFDPDLNNLSTPDLGTFAHEYVHYLQNITTIFGLRNSVFYFRYLYELKSYIAKNSELQLPIKDADIDFTDILKRGKQLFDQYHGTKEIFTPAFDEVKVSLKKVATTEIPCLQLYYKGKLVNSVLVGNLCVKEGMAHLIQSLYDPGVKHDTFPYLAVEILCEHLNPKMAEDKRRLISACLIALNSQNSGLALYEIILKEQSDVSGKELYAKLLNEHKVIYQSKEISIKEFLLSSIEEFRLALSNSIYAELNHFNRLLDNIKLSVSEEVCPLIEMLYKDSGVDGLHGLINFYGIPYIRTIDGYLHFPSETLGSTQEQIASELIDLMGQSIVLDRVLELNESAPTCSFYAICQLDEADLTDDNCFSTQWKRSTPCPFKIVSDNWRLDEKIKSA